MNKLQWMMACALPVILVGCTSIEKKAFESKQDAIQLPLTALPDGASFTWRESSLASGTMQIRKTFQKGSVVCRLVVEDERVAGGSEAIVSTYCLTANGRWE